MRYFDALIPVLLYLLTVRTVVITNLLADFGAKSGGLFLEQAPSYSLLLTGYD